MRAQNGQMIQVYDPLTSRQVAGGAFLRDQFPGNVIPASRINPISKKMLSFWPEPNLPGDPVTSILNFISNASEKYGVDQFNVRSTTPSPTPTASSAACPGTVPSLRRRTSTATPETQASGRQLFTQRNVALNDTHAFSPHTFATFRAGFIRLRDSGQPFSIGYDPAELGFPSSFVNAFSLPAFPSITVNNYTITNVGFGTGSIGPVVGALLNNISNGYTAQSDVTHIRGKHVFKVGMEYRLFRLHGFRPAIPTFTFSPNFTQGPDPTKGSPTAGDSFASYLLGTAANGNVQMKPTQDTQTYYFGAFLQDDYKITSRLTLNLGLRHETENLRTDRYNRLNYLDFNSRSPLQAPGLPELRGGLRFTGVDGNPREQARVNHMLEPRFGFAYMARSTTVIRGGYGIFAAPRTGWDFGSFGQAGYSATTSLIASIDGITPNVNLSDPYPNGFVRPSGSSLGMLTDVGGGLNSIDRDQKSIYLQQWNFNIQQSLPGDVVIDAAYAGSKGTHLLQALQYNQLPDQYLSKGNELITRVPNPFYGLIPATQALGTATVAAGQLLRPYPQFNGFATIGSTSGSSIYHSFQMRVEKRFSHGFTSLLSYTNGKLIDDGGPGRNAFFGSVPNFQNNNNRKLERSISSQEVSQRLSIAATYDLPLGKGKRFLLERPFVRKPDRGRVADQRDQLLPRRRSPRIDHVGE